MDPITLGVLAAAQIGLGVYQTAQASRGLKALQRQGMPTFNITPEQANSYRRAEEMARGGYTPAEEANFLNRLRRSENAATRRALDLSGGNLASAISNVNMARNTDALNRFATEDASLMRSNIRYADQVGESITNQRNRDTQARLNYRLMAEQALGRAKSQGLQNITQGVMTPVSLGLLEGIGGGMGTGTGANAIPVDYSYLNLSGYNMNNPQSISAMQADPSLNMAPGNPYGFPYQQSMYSRRGLPKLAE